MTYRQYLNCSDDWKATKKQVFERALQNANCTNRFGICEKCGYQPYKPCLQVHHKSYGENMNRLDNLVLLCPRCHKAEHGK